MIFKKVKSPLAGLRHLEDVVTARRAFLSCHRRKNVHWELDQKLLQQARADLERCRKLWEDKKHVELSAAFTQAGVSVQPRNRQPKRPREAA